ncbi:hypothetical protein BC939DRAFT_449930 [Gamsiella multidivaricata]|uniref:uncharacterized protein n=1 Tax=Gamsiella multidivaricata TaxID=101098 RepID=UPI00221EE946|nr:uncharacterized protein BC939DRAFT_449930 [Gamsiella multidivaricata]KAI7824744.1 hypothetical protein BC939DRAFT_449930 [Gamsiella multidivaricata]
MGMRINREVDFGYAHKRIEADRQVRDRFYTMHNEVDIPVFIMISAFDRRCCVYRYTRGVTRQLSVTTPALVLSGPRWSNGTST